MKNLSRYPTQYFNDFQEKLTADHVQSWLQKVSSQMNQCQSFEDWEKAVFHWNEVKSHIETHLEKASLAFYRNTRDEGAEAEEKRLREEIEPPYKKLNAEIRDKMLRSSQQKALREKLGEQYFQILQIEQDAFLPLNIQIETEISDILSRYTKLTGSAEIEVGGQKYPMSHQAKFANSADPKIRFESYGSFTKWFFQNRDEMESIFDDCVERRDQMGKKLGYPDYIPLGYQKMRRTDYGPEEVKKFREQIRTVMVPLAKKIREQQAKSQGKSRLSVWDGGFFPDWQVPKLKVEISEQLETGQKVFSKLSPILGKHFQKMIDAELIDLPARMGKAPGAFCTGFSDYRVPFVFLNSVGEGSDVTTLLHESGHAFQAWESGPIDLLELQSPTLEACEVHSMGMEFLAHPHYEEFFFPEDAVKYRRRHLAESILILPYIAMVDEFQHAIYSGEAKGKSGRAKVWKELEQKYMPDLDYGEFEQWKECRWIRQLHIFKYPFYYIDYAIAQVGAWQLWVQSVKNLDQAMENYLNLCRLGGTLPLKKFFEAGKLKLPFEEGVLEGLMREVLSIEPIF